VNAESISTSDYLAVGCLAELKAMNTQGNFLAYGRQVGLDAGGGRVVRACLGRRRGKMRKPMEA